MVGKHDKLEYDNVVSLHCFETDEIDIREAWDVCKIKFENGEPKILNGIYGIKIENDHINRMVSDDDVLYVRFITPSELTLYKG